MVYDLEIPSQGGIFITDRIEAMRARYNDLPYSRRTQRGDVLGRLFLVKVLVAQTASRVAGARLTRPQDGEADPCIVEQARH